MKENNFDTVKNAGNKYSIENLQNKKYFKNMDEAIKVYEEFRRFKDNGFIESIDPDFFKNLTDMFLSDYKRVLKENEELRQEKIDNQKINLLAQNSMLDYQNGYEDGKANRRSAVQSIIDNQQYYIFQKQIEKYEKEIEKLQKENEELKNLMAHKNDYTKKLEEDLFENCSNYVIPVQKVKDKIEYLDKQQKQWLEDRELKASDSEIIFARDFLQELLERRE